MYAVLVITLLVVGVANGYDSKYDDINIDEIVQNERLINNYFNCFMDKGLCTPEGEEVKSEYMILYLILKKTFNFSRMVFARWAGNIIPTNFLSG